MLPRIESLSNSFKSMPSIVIDPEFGSYNLQRRLNMVDLPEPLFPTKDTVSFLHNLKYKRFDGDNSK